MAGMSSQGDGSHERSWKLVTDGRTPRPAAFYNISADPYELDNRLDDQTGIEAQAALQAALSNWRQRAVACATTESIALTT